MKNLNYGKTSMPSGIDGGTGNGIDGGIEKNANNILNAILSNPKITQRKLADATNLSIRTIARELKNLRESGMIKRVGSDKSGYWEPVK